jgi:hypothetical protein
MVYTISPDIIRSIEKDEMYYFTDLLYVIAQRKSPFKIAIDNKSIVIEDYKSIDNHNRHLIKSWLDLMSFKPSPFEKVNIELKGINCEETRYLTLCKNTVSQQKIIFYSKQNINRYKCVLDIIDFEETEIKVLDKDDAIQEFSNSEKGNIHIEKSQIALDGSQIIKSKNS